MLDCKQVEGGPNMLVTAMGGIGFGDFGVDGVFLVTDSVACIEFHCHMLTVPRIISWVPNYPVHDSLHVATQPYSRRASVPQFPSNLISRLKHITHVDWKEPSFVETLDSLLFDEFRALDKLIASSRER